MPQDNRNGGDVVIESLEALGASTVFGIPGQHALGLFDALRRSGLKLVASRVENNAAFAADGHARITGQVSPLFLSTGPGALTALAGLQESKAASVPVLVICSQIPSEGLGGARKGFLHELPDQQAAAANVVKSTTVVRKCSQIPSAIAEAWRKSMTPPYGPTWVEIPQDILLAPATVPPVGTLNPVVDKVSPRGELVEAAVEMLENAQRPVILAGGGVVRAGAQAELLRLAERLRAPVATTFGGKAAFEWHHPLSIQSWQEDAHMRDFLEDADVLLVVGTGLGELSSHYYTLSPTHHVIQIEADLGKLESNHSALGIHADAKIALDQLSKLVTQRESDGISERRAVDLLDQVHVRLATQDLGLERGIVSSVRSAVDDDCATFWDMTILGYWAWSAWDARHGVFESAQGAGGLGYALPAAIGAASAGNRDNAVLAVTGDGGAMYGISELAVLAQYDLPVTWLIVDDGGYGILREYMNDSFGAATATELARPDFVALAEAFGVTATLTNPSDLQLDLEKALQSGRPHVVVLPTFLRMFAPTHL